MRSKGWNEGAILLEEWLRRPANIRTAKLKDTPNNFGPAVLNVITMDWILSFTGKSPIRTYNQILNEKIWKNDKAKPEIGKMLAPRELPLRREPRRNERLNSAI